MREIKFRAWWLDHCSALENGEYIKSWKLSPVHSIHFNKGIAMLTGGMVKSVRSVPIDEECILEQFTGLRDKNGREMYEGDIVVALETGITGYLEWFNGRVMWTDGAGHWDIVDWDTEDIVEDVLMLEVIGNIHNNPELLEDTK